MTSANLKIGKLLLPLAASNYQGLFVNNKSNTNVKLIGSKNTFSAEIYHKKTLKVGLFYFPPRCKIRLNRRRKPGTKEIAYRLKNILDRLIRLKKANQLNLATIKQLPQKLLYLNRIITIILQLFQTEVNFPKLLLCNFLFTLEPSE